MTESADSDASAVIPSDCFTADASLSAALRLFQSLQAGELPDTDAREWFCTEFFNWLKGDGQRGQIFGLRRQQTQLMLRNQHLRQAWNLVVVTKPGRMARAQALLDEIQRFQRNAASGPRPNWSNVRLCIWQANQLGRLPATWEQLATICNPLK